MPLDLGHDPAGAAPGLGLVAEAGVETPDLVGRTPHRTLEQMSNPALENRIGGQADDIAVILRLQEFVNLGRGKTRIGAEVGAPFLLAVGWAHAGEPPGVSRTEQRFGELRLGSPRA